MRATFSVPLALLLLGAGSCGLLLLGAPVRFSGPSLEAIAGEWSGSYESRERGRGGSLLFSLSISGDTARGEVTLVPRATGVAVAPGTRQRPPSLTIRFVRGEDDRLQGILDPYEDPACRCTVLTTFSGRLGADGMRGIFVTRGRDGTAESMGTWTVQRAVPLSD